jgi:hypothetical protein
MEMADSKKEDSGKPKAGAADVAHTAVRVGLSVIPVVGGAAKEIFTAIVTPPLVRRRDEWVESIARELKELERKVENFSMENLSKNEAFVSAVTYATTLAIRNHQKEKLYALRNAVLNTALSSGIDEDQTHMFLNYIDTFTQWHIQILKFFNDPQDWAKKNNITFPQYAGGPASAVLEHAFPELKGNRDFYNQIAKDLSDRGLMSNGQSLHTMMTSGGMLGSRTTRVGKRFIEFIGPPAQI